MLRRRAAGWWLGLAVFVACLTNGAGSYLRRTGLIETAKYEAFWNVHTGPGGWKTSPFGLGRRCVLHVGVPPGSTAPTARYVFDREPWELPGRLLKDLLLVALGAGSLLAWLRRKGGPVPLARSWPSAALAGLVGWKLAAGLAAGAYLMAAAGLRAFTFLGVALFAGWVTADVLRRLVPWLVGLLAAQAFLAPLELLRGVPVQGHAYVFGEYFARRATGTFGMPNTLGVFAACVVALAAGYGATARVRGLAWLFGTVVILAAGSATGLVLLVVLGLWEAVSAHRGAARVAAVVAAGGFLALVLVYLPDILTRWDVYHSAHARLQAMRAAVQGPTVSVVFGRGIGLGTNASHMLKDGIGGGRGLAAGDLEGGDSAVVALVLQTGVLGLGLFLLGLGVAARQTPAARPLVFVLALATLSLSLTEAFPINLLLALVLGGGQVYRLHSTRPRRV